MSTTAQEAVSRLKKVQIEDFRGWVGRHELDTNADLVLITGPNGTGKTGLMEALLLLLTGWWDKRVGMPKVADLISIDSGAEPGEDEQARRKDAFQIKAEALIEPPETDPRSTQLQVGATGNGKTAEGSEGPGEKWLPPTGLPPSAIQEPELAARLCGFFQDRVLDLFDEASSGATLRDVFEPLPLWLSQVGEYLSEGKTRDTPSEEGFAGPLLRALQGKLQDLETQWQRRQGDLERRLQRRSREDLSARLSQALDTLKPLYAALVGERADWPEPSPGDNVALTAFAVAVLKREGLRLPRAGTEEIDTELPRSFGEALKKELGDQLLEARRQAGRTTATTAELQAKLDDLDAEVARIRGQYPDLERDLALFEAENARLPSAPAVFRALADNAARWAAMRLETEGSEAERFARVLEDLAAVEPTEAGKCAEILDGWMAPRRVARERLDTLAQERRRLERELRLSFSSTEVERLQQLRRDLDRVLYALRETWEEERAHIAWEQGAPGRDEARGHLERAMGAVQSVSQALAVVQSPDRELMEGLKNLVELVLGRFSLVDGILPLRLATEDQPGGGDYRVRRVYNMYTANGRRLGELSTGQLAQAAVATLTGQNQALSHLLPHRVILLDDVTTAYDLSNLTREAILWRQLAYGGKERTRRQVFISSHHEDLTNHLLDLLVPPAGHHMRLIRITGWTPKKGPSYEQFDVHPTCTSLAPGVAEDDKTMSKSPSEAARAFAADLEHSAWQPS